MRLVASTSICRIKELDQLVLNACRLHNKRVLHLSEYSHSEAQFRDFGDPKLDTLLPLLPMHWRCNGKNTCPATALQPEPAVVWDLLVWS